MTFFQELQQATQQEREYLLSAPIIQRCFAGDFSKDDYIAFLKQAYHHVKHTVPLLMSTGSRLPQNKEWLREAVAEYIEEELGHQKWIINDLAACGVNRASAENSQPSMATEIMVSYAYDSINRVNPLCFFGMVFVLEGTSIHLADQAAGMIAEKLSLPAKAFSYLKSHGALDQEHIVFFENLMNQITHPEEKALIIHSAKMFFMLYGAIFYELSPKHGLEMAA